MSHLTASAQHSNAGNSGNSGINEKDLQSFADELKLSAAKLAKKHGFEISDVNPKTVNRGTGLSIALRGGIPGVKQVFRAMGAASREALRFMDNYKSVGLTKGLLDQEIKLKSAPKKTFKVLGLKGQKNDVVLCDIATSEHVSVPVEHFKTSLVR